MNGKFEENECKIKITESQTVLTQYCEHRCQGLDVDDVDVW